MSRAVLRRGVGTLAALAVLVSCQRDDPPEKAPVPVRIEVVRAAQPGGAGGGPAGRHYSASVQPNVAVELDFQVEGTIAEITQIGAAGGRRILQPGDLVEKGQVLARVDKEAYVDKVEEAKGRAARAGAALANAEATWGRDSNLYATKSITAPEYDRAKKEYESAQADVASASAALDRAKLKLAECNLTSPRDGIVLARSIEVGSYVRPGSPAFQVGDISSVKVAFGVPAGERAAMGVGETLEFATAATGARRFEGVITSVAPSADQRTRVFEIQATVANPDGVLLPGMIASVVTGGQQTPGGAPLVVPLRAVFRAPDDPEGFAAAVVDGEGSGATASVRTISLGEVHGADVIVTSGLDAGDRLIVTGSTHVSDGSPVRVVP